MEIEVKKSKKPPPIERRIVLLKDFLRDDMNSCSSSGFKSFPRKTCCTSSIRNLLELDLKSQNPKKLLLKSQSQISNPKPSTTTTISAFQKASIAVIKVVKNLTFSSSSKSSSNQMISSFPLSLPRSLSRRLRRSLWKKNDSSNKVEREIKVAVRVKDIMRWKSFRDLIEDKPNTTTKSLDCSSVSQTKSSSKTSSTISWSDSDFTTESLNSSTGSSSSTSTSSESSSSSSGGGEIDEVNSCSNKNLPAEENKIWKTNKDIDLQEDSNSMEKKVDCQSEKDHFSPVSVLDFLPSEEDEESLSSQSIVDNVDKKNQKIRRLETINQLEPVNLDERISSFELINQDNTSSNNTSECQEEQEHDDDDEQEFIKTEDKARKLVQIIRETSSTTISEELICNSTLEDHLLLDFFTDEIIERSTKRVSTLKENELNEELLNIGRDWINGKCGVILDWGFEESRKVYLREIEKGGNWRITEEEEEEVGLDMEITIIDSLINEVIVDFSS